MKIGPASRTLQIVATATTIFEIIARYGNWEKLRTIQDPFKYFIFIVLVMASFAMFIVIILKVVDLRDAIGNRAAYILTLGTIAVVAGAFLALMLMIDWHLTIEKISLYDQSDKYILLCFFTIPIGIIYAAILEISITLSQG